MIWRFTMFDIYYLHKALPPACPAFKTVTLIIHGSKETGVNLLGITIPRSETMSCPF